MLKSGNDKRGVRLVVSSAFFAVAGLVGTTALNSILVAPAMAQNFAFSDIVVEGSTRVSRGTILSYADLAVGQNFSAAELNDAYQAVIKSGLFRDVEFVPNGSTLVIKVSEYPLVSKIAIEGNRVISDKALQPLLKTQTRRVYSPTTVEQDALAIVEAYEFKGQLAATITPKIIERPNNRVDVVFEVSEGKGVEIERLSFVGNRAYSDRRLRRVLDTKQAGLFRFIVGRDTYAEDRVEFDKRLLTDFYQSRGFVDFQVLNVASNLSRERDAFFISFNVREGLKYEFGNISVSSQMRGVEEAPFVDVVNIKAGQTYSPEAIDTVISRMETLATDKGIDFLRVEPRIVRNEASQTLDVEFVISRGERIFVERIDIAGNKTTLDRVVRREFTTVEGDPFNPREIRAAAERIRALGYFGNADVETRPGSGNDQVIIDVNVEEQPTGSFSIGANYSIANGANFIASFSERNFLGRGQRLSFNLTTELDTGSLGFNFVEPAFLGRDVSFGLSANLGTSSPRYADHEVRRFTLSPRLGFPVSKQGNLSLFYRYASGEVRNPDGNTLPALIKADVDEGKFNNHTLGYSYSFDNRRSGLNPNAGVLLQFSQEYTGLGGGNDVLKTTAEVAGRLSLLNEDLTLTAALEGGILKPKGTSRVDQRFFNGTSIIRGFEPGGIGPRDVGGTELALGGNAYAVARLEAKFPLGIPEEYGISGGVFFDHGAVWNLGNPGTIDDDLHWRSVLGTSIFWTTPIGPLRFNFTRALNAQDYDRPQNFDLTLSTGF